MLPNKTNIRFEKVDKRNAEHIELLLELYHEKNEDVVGKNIIIIEDIVDTGTTLNYLKKFLAAREANSVEICAMLDKPARRKTEVDVKYVGFKVENKFIVGYGLDCDQQYRQLPYITCIDNDE